MHADDPTPAPSQRSQSSEAATARQAPLALWRVAQAFLLTLAALFGTPEDVARTHTLTGKAHAFMAGWMRCAEALMRRLLLIEAAAFPKPNTRPLLKPRRKRSRQLMGFDAEHPEKWRVSFRCFSSADRRLPAGKPALQQAQVWADRSIRCRLEAGAPPRRQLRSAWPLAERYEALLRVFNDPAPYALRLSRRLHATPHRLIEPLRASPEAAQRVELFDNLGERARAAWRPRFSSA